MHVIKTWFNKFLIQCNEHAERVGNPYRAWGIFGAITYPLYHLMWIGANRQGYENLPLRLVVVALCIPLILKNQWPSKLTKYLPIYWYFNLLYSLPFLFTFLLLKNNFSYIWILNVTSLLTLAVLLLDWISLTIIFPIGIFLGWLSFVIVGGVLTLPDNLWGILIVYLSIVINGALFAHRKDVIRNEKLQIMKSLSANIAHELRTPLRSIGAGVSGIKRYLPVLLESHELAKKAKVEVPSISTKNYNLLHSVCDDIGLEVKSAFTTIDVLLANVNHTALKNIELKICSMKDCVDEALLHYPFDPGEAELVYIDKLEDFAFKGDKTTVVHILFNLLKNALYYIQASEKAEARITIWTHSDKKYNYLHFKDTGTGIEPKVLDHIFERFYSKTRHGSGIGLSFCKYAMETMGGSITCSSIQGEYTEFCMEFPLIKNSH
ncbi:MAG: HAMP domain-containing sensor histidine kinase [Gammaproteobacteria bacterium]